MPVISAELRKLFAQTNLMVLPEDYYSVKLPLDVKPIPGEWYRPATTRFAVFMREPRQISLIVARRKWLRMQNLFDRFEVSGPMKVVSFDTEFAGKVCGYMATIGSLLADEELCAIPISTVGRDHILVNKQDLPRTVKVLRGFIDKCRKVRRPVKKQSRGTAARK
ncbi:MAG: ACT domain-containing protein [Acidobacteriota bacterium]